MKTYYEILGVSEKATHKEIKSAYKVLMKKYHPDVYKGNDKIAAEINNAYDILSNPKTREEYDLELKEQRDRIINQNQSYQPNAQNNYKTTTNKNYSTYRRESAQDIYNRILKNKVYKNEDYSNSYSYRTIKNAQNYVEKKLISLTYFQLLLIVLGVITFCVIGLAFSIMDINNISKIRKNKNNIIEDITTTQTPKSYYYPPYNETEDTEYDYTQSINDVMISYGFDKYFDNIQDFYMFIIDKENQDLYFQLFNQEITQDEYFKELAIRAAERVK